MADVQKEHVREKSTAHQEIWPALWAKMRSNLTLSQLEVEAHRKSSGTAAMMLQSAETG
jgi:hypothetical protein